MKRRLKLTLIILASLSMGLESATTEVLAGAESAGTTDDHRSRQRQQYRDALHFLRTNRISRYQRLKTELQTYPLYPYLEYNEIAYRIKRKSEADILAFVNRYQDTPLAAFLDQRWLAYLATGGRWGDFIDYYEVARDRMKLTRKLSCHLAHALYRQGRMEEAMDHARELWLVEYSQPDECDAVFIFWGDNGGLTGELVWRRFAMSIRANQGRLAGYLLRFIDRKDKAAAASFFEVRRNPARIKQIRKFQKPGSRNREIILYGVTKLARTDPESALKALRGYHSLHDFDPDALELAYAQVGKFLALKTNKPELSRSLPVNLHAYPELAEGNIRQTLRYLDWGGVLVGINLLPSMLQVTPRWQYWKARVLYRSDQVSDRQRAKEMLLALSEERTFYGFLAADMLDKSYNYHDEAFSVTQDQILSLEQSPAMQRVLELFALGERGKARREWNFATTDYTAQELGVAAAVALRQGWYSVAIQAMNDAGTWDYLDFRFPLAWQEVFSFHAATVDVPLPWSLATARQESAFMSDAKSPAGALGLMQLLPATAAMIARSLGIKYRNRASLTNPDFNIKLGVHYLGGLFQKYDNNRILASAAYNAGPRRVDSWLNTNVPVDVWVEVIPITETRNYVQNVLMFSSIYNRKLGASRPFIYSHERAFFSSLSAESGQANPSPAASAGSDVF